MARRLLVLLVGFAIAAIPPFTAVLRAQIVGQRPSALQHVTVVANEPSDPVRPGSVATLSVDVTPKPNIHVYAAGAKGFTPVALYVSPVAGAEIGKPKYPEAELLASPGSDRPVPVYRKPFRILQPVTIPKSARSGQVLSLAGAVNYESCDDRMCFPLLSIPVSWNVKVE